MRNNKVTCEADATAKRREGRVAHGLQAYTSPVSLKDVNAVSQFFDINKT